MLIGMYTGNYTGSTPEEIIVQLPCDDKAKAADIDIISTMLFI